MCFRGCEKEKAMLRCMVRKKVEKEERRGLALAKRKGGETAVSIKYPYDEKKTK
jgi:hypothetical protein